MQVEFFQQLSDLNKISTVTIKSWGPYQLTLIRAIKPEHEASKKLTDFEPTLNWPKTARLIEHAVFARWRSSFAVLSEPLI